MASAAAVPMMFRSVATLPVDSVDIDLLACVGYNVPDEIHLYIISSVPR